MLRALRLALAITALPLITSAAIAQSVAFGAMKADVSLPVEVAADNFSVNQSTGMAEFSGNVLIGQGEMKLSADQVVVEYAEGGESRIRNLRATGNVTLVNGPGAAEAQEAVYEVSTGDITLIGDVLLTQGDNVMSGERLTVNLANGTAQASGRVRTVLQPGSN